MLAILLFFVVGLLVISGVLAPFIKKANQLDRQLNEQRPIRQPEPPRLPLPFGTEEKRKNDSVLDQFAQEKVARKEQMEQFDEKEEVLFKLREQINRREAFRIGVMDTPCTFVMYPNAQEGTGKVMDVSATGMRLHSPHNVIMDAELSLLLSFSLHNETFVLRGTLLRKQMLNPYRFEYGITFIYEHPAERERLFRVLWQEHRKQSRQII